jgi:outer membrane lipoprotein-sorting protein
MLAFPLLFAQKDPAALKILDSFSGKASKAPSVFMKFIMVTTDLAEHSADSVKGSIILSRDSYRLDLGDNITWFNGETSWNYLTAEQEVTITKPNRKDQSFQSKPSAIFTMYKTGYKTRLIEENQNSYIIDLYPEDVKSDLVRVRLVITKPGLSLATLEYKRRDGIVVDLRLSDYDLSRKPEPGTFEFQPDRYKGAEINDLR